MDKQSELRESIIKAITSAHRPFVISATDTRPYVVVPLGNGEAEILEVTKKDSSTLDAPGSKIDFLNDNSISLIPSVDNIVKFGDYEFDIKDGIAKLPADFTTQGMGIKWNEAKFIEVDALKNIATQKWE